jgi:SAM-dependent methyltransferase
MHADVKVKQLEIIVDDAENLDKFDSDSLDFIIANHVLEHCHDPIGTLLTWADRLKSGGVVYAAVPDKEHTFDKPRAVTELAHLVSDYLDGYAEGDKEHYREWHYIIDGLRGKELDDRVQECINTRANIHFHVFDRAAMVALFDFVGDAFEVLESAQHGAEIIWVLRKKFSE